MKKPQNQRKFRNILIKKDFQIRLAVTNLMFMGIVLVVLIAALLSPIYYDIYHGKELWTQYVSAQLLWRLLDRIGIAFILLLALVFVYQVFYSHRVCGPLVNFNHTFERIAQGDLTRKIYLRRHDFLKSEATQANIMLDALHRNITELKKAHNTLAAVAADLQPNQTIDRQNIVRLRDALQSSRSLLDYWRTEA